MRASALSMLLAPLVLAAPNAGSAPKGIAALAHWDGKCFYPVPTGDFKLDKFTGRWFWVAGTASSFTTPGCRCNQAEYKVNKDGTVGVTDICELNGQRKVVPGSATQSGAQYGKSGVFRVDFPGEHQGPNVRECKGPTYIVQEHKDDIAIIGSSNFTNVGILSRKQQLNDRTIDEWIDRAGQLGGDLSQVIKIDHAECKKND